MWALSNKTPYGAGRNWIRDKNGAHHWVVAVKATFDIEPGGKLKLSDEQPPPVLAPEYFGEPGTSSLRYESDLLAAKAGVGTDVLVHADAWAPGGKPTPMVAVSLRLPGVEKVLVVRGERGFYQGVIGVETTKPIPFVRQPIRYERAFGGKDFADRNPAKHRIDERNPIGRGFATKKAHLVKQLAHTIEYPKGDPEKVGPAGYGPIDSSWAPRIGYAGTYDAAWEKSKRPLLPDDYDERFALCAPSDQRTERPLRGGERVECINLTPQGRLVVELPKINFTCSTSFGAKREEHRGHLVTVILELAPGEGKAGPGTMKLAMVWQTTLEVRSKDADYLDQTEIAEKPELA